MEDFTYFAHASLTTLAGSFPTTGATDALAGIDAAAMAGGGSGASDSLVASILMIFVSEIGDKTFLIAAILAMSNPRLTIFLAACSALWLMSILSAFLGHAMVTYIPMSLVSVAAAVMFLVFGVKLLFEARKMDGSEIAKEMHEVEAELSEMDATTKTQLAMEAGEAGDGATELESFNVNVGDDHVVEGVRESGAGSVLCSLKNLLGLLLSPVFVETFVLVFLAEWGDRSQLATIALGAARNVYGVAVGTILGHTCCTGLAVAGGQLLAARISVKKVTYAGGVLFIIFAVLYGYESLATTA